MKLKRIEWIDQLRGIAMLAVIFGHMPVSENALTYLYSFHLPLFFAISGMTYYIQTSKPSWSEMTLWGNFVDKAKKLLLPYLFFNILLFPVWVFNFKVLGNSNYPIKNVLFGIVYSNEAVYTGPTNATWFLTVLFLVSILFFILEKHLSSGQLTIAILFCGIIGYMDSLSKTKIYAPWHIQTVFTGIVFYYLGFIIIKSYPSIQKKLSSIDPVDIKYIIIVFILLVSGYCLSQINTKVSMHKNEYNSLLLFYSAAMITFLAIFLIVHKLPPIKFDFIKYIGQNTLIYVAFHCPMLRFLENYNEGTYHFAHLHPYITGGGITLLIVPLCIIINKFFPFLVGKKYVKANKSKEAAKACQTIR